MERVVSRRGTFSRPLLPLPPRLLARDAGDRRIQEAAGRSRIAIAGARLRTRPASLTAAWPEARAAQPRASPRLGLLPKRCPIPRQNTEIERAGQPPPRVTATSLPVHESGDAPLSLVSRLKIVRCSRDMGSQREAVRRRLRPASGTRLIRLAAQRLRRLGRRPDAEVAGDGGSEAWDMRQCRRRISHAAGQPPDETAASPTFGRLRRLN